MSPELNAVAQAVVALKSRRIDDSVSAWSIAHELAETITGRERRGVPNMVAWPVFEGDLKEAAGVCGGRGGYGESTGMRVEVDW
jgi:hypothetical protein